MSILPWVLGWSWSLAGVALAYGQYVGMRHARGRPPSIRETIRDFLVLHAIGVGAFASIWFWALPTLLFGLAPGMSPAAAARPVMTSAQALRVLATIALAPLGVWYGFALPLRLTRRLTRPAPVAFIEPHPLDGAWPGETSFLDRIAEAREADAGPAGLKAHPPSRALDRVGRLAPARRDPT